MAKDKTIKQRKSRLKSKDIVRGIVTVQTRVPANMRPLLLFITEWMRDNDGDFNVFDLHAKIDAYMIEHCPNAMTSQQLAVYEAAQIARQDLVGYDIDLLESVVKRFNHGEVI